MTVKSACEILGVMFDPLYKGSKLHKEMMLDEAKEQFLFKIRINHPDVGGSHDKTIELIEAHNFLKKALSTKEAISVTEWFEIRQNRHKEKLKDETYVAELKKKKAEADRKRREANRKNNPPKPRGKSIFQIAEDGTVIKEWNSAKEAASALNTDVSAICKCAKGAKYYKLAAGFIWKYKEKTVDNSPINT